RCVLFRSEIDWGQVEKKFQEFVQGSTPVNNNGKVEVVANATIFSNAFKTLELTGHAARDAKEFKDWLGSDLSIPYHSRDAIKEMTRRELSKAFREQKPRIERLPRGRAAVNTGECAAET